MTTERNKENNTMRASQKQENPRSHLVRVDKDDLRQAQRKQHVEKQDLVAPDDALLLLLAPQPRRPAVGDELNLEIVLLKTTKNYIKMKEK